MVSAFAQAKAPSIEGVWKITSVVTTGANAASNTKPRPNAPAAKDPNKPTDAETRALYAMWNPLTAQAGTYQLSGNTLTRRPTWRRTRR